MKGFGIYVKNDLLEPKHIQNMGEAVWLYLWLLDKMTSVNENGVGKVLGNQPITYLMIKVELGIPERTYTRWVSKLRNAGYIHTLRTPYGLCFMITKATKRFQKRTAKSGASSSAKNGSSELKEIRQKVQRDTPKSVPRTAKLADVIKTKQDYTKTIQTTTNVVVANESPKVVYGKPEINEAFVYWQTTTGLEIHSRVKANRIACSNLIKKHGIEGVKRLIQGAALAQGKPYAPQIANFCDLQDKLDKLLVWGRQQSTKSTTGVVR